MSLIDFQLAALLNTYGELSFGHDHPEEIIMGDGVHRLFVELTGQQCTSSGPHLNDALILLDRSIPEGAVFFRNLQKPNDPRFNRFLDFTDYVAERQRKESSFVSG